jgi:hypothetical protein
MFLADKMLSADNMLSYNMLITCYDNMLSVDNMVSYFFLENFTHSLKRRRHSKFYIEQELTYIIKSVLSAVCKNAHGKDIAIK